MAGQLPIALTLKLTFLLIQSDTVQTSIAKMIASSRRFNLLIESYMIGSEEKKEEEKDSYYDFLRCLASPSNANLPL